MSTNLVILYPHYLLEGDKETFPSGAAGFPSSNVVAGCRQDRFRTVSAAAPSASTIFDINITRLPDDEKSPDYIYIAGLRLSTDRENVNVSVEGYDTAAFSGAVDSFSASDVTSADCAAFGRNAEDYVIEAGSVSPCNFWRVVIQNAGDSAAVLECRKIFLGQWLDLGTDPEVPVSFYINPEDKGKRQYRRVINLSWRGVSNVMLHKWQQKIVARAYTPICLYARGWDAILNEEQLFYCQLRTSSYERLRHDMNRITAEFIECI